MSEKLYSKVNISKLPNSEIEIEAEIEAKVLEKHRKLAIKALSLSAEIPGFRKGHVPEKILIDKFGEMKILEDASQGALQEAYPEILSDNKIKSIGRPHITITSIAIGNPLKFKIKTAILPDFNMPDYLEIAKVEMNKPDDPVEVNDKEVEDVIKSVRQQKAYQEYHQKHKLDSNNHNHLTESKRPEIKDEDLPIADDEFAKSIGPFKDLDDLKGKIKENITKEKQVKSIEKKRAAIISALLKDVKIDVPEVLIQSESDKIISQMKSDIERQTGKFEDYLTQIKKTEEEIRKDMYPDAKNRAKTQIIFNKIIAEKKLEPNKEILEKEVKEILKHYPEASEENAKIYVTTVLLNAEVIKLFEKQKEQK